MNPIHSPGKDSLWSALLSLVCVVLLAGCQVPGLLPGLLPNAVESQAEERATETPRPTLTPRQLEPLPATFTPTPVLPTLTPTLVPDLPELLAGFPLFDGANLDPAETISGSHSAGIALISSKSPGELAVLFREALEAAGWTLRYSEGNQVGGFVQEWKRDNVLLTVEYHFSGDQPVVHVDARIIDANQALAPLQGFLLPNGTEVVRKVGPAIELYIPEDMHAAVDDFKTQVASLNWRLELLKPTGWCGSRGCQEIMKEAYQSLAALEPAPTPDERKAEYYRVTMPDRTQADFTFLPRRDHTRVYVNINFQDLRRSGMPITEYPHSTITGVMPGVAMFEVKADIKDVIKFYEDGLAWLYWEAMPFTVNTGEMYARSWRKDPGRVISLSLSSSRGTVYGQLTCVQCTDPYYRIPTTTPTVAPSK